MAPLSAMFMPEMHSVSVFFSQRIMKGLVAWAPHPGVEAEVALLLLCNESVREDYCSGFLVSRFRSSLKKSRRDDLFVVMESDIQKR